MGLVGLELLLLELLLPPQPVAMVATTMRVAKRTRTVTSPGASTAALFYHYGCAPAAVWRRSCLAPVEPKVSVTGGALNGARGCGAFR